MKFRKLKMKLKRVIAGFMAAVTIFLSVFNANTLPVQAAEVGAAFVLTEELVALIQMFLASMGIVVSKSEIQSSNYESYINSVLDGFTQTVKSYDVEDVYSWSDPTQIGLLASSIMLNAKDMQEEQLSEICGNSGINKRALATMMMLDSSSYALFGTTASTALMDGVEWIRDTSDNIVGYTRKVKGNLAEVVDFREFKAHLTEIGGGNNPDDGDGDDDGDDDAFQQKIKKFAMNGGLFLIWLAEATSAEDLSSSGRKPGTTEFTQFSSSTFTMPEGIYYSGYEIVNGQYNLHGNPVFYFDNGYYDVFRFVETTNLKVAGYIRDNGQHLSFRYMGPTGMNNFNFNVDCNRHNPDGSIYYTYTQKMSSVSGTSGHLALNVNFPVFSSLEECNNFLIGNINDSTAINRYHFDFGDYKNFLNTVPQGSYLSNLLEACAQEDGSLDEEAFWALSNQLEKAATGASDAPALGTSQGYGDYGSYYEQLKPDPAPGPVPDPEPGTDPTPAPDTPSDPESPIDYSSILSAILSGIMSLPELIFKAFKALLTDIFNAIMLVPQEIIDFFTDPMAFIQEKIEGIFNTVEGLWDNGKGILENIILLPGKIAEAFGFPEFSAMIEAGIQSLLDAMQFNQLIESLDRGFAGVLDALAGLLFDPASILLSLQAFKEGVLGKIDSVIDALKGIAEALPDGAGGGDDGESPEDDDDDGFEIKDFFKLFIYLILILLMLIVIFVNCLKFIIMIFKVPATTGFLPADMVSGITFLKSLEITGMGISVYDFSLFLINLMLVFAVIRLLRREIAHFKIPRKY